MNSQETWKDVNGYEGRYQVSDDGKVLSVTNNQILRPKVTRDGYATVNLRGKSTRVHRAVAIAFIPNPENKPEVNHKDHNRQNNKVSNLEWCTRWENIMHSKKGKLTISGAMNIRKRLEAGDSPSSICKDYNISHSSVSRIRRFEMWNIK